VTLYVGLDDTDTRDLGGTGRLARALADALAPWAAGEGTVSVSRHQLLQDPRVPCTRKNRCSCVVLAAPEAALEAVARAARAFVGARAEPGSDPGLCVAPETRVTEPVVAFGRAAQARLLDAGSAVAIAARAGLILQSLGGTLDGVIGALAAVGLRRSGQDGWLTQGGQLRRLQGVRPVSALRAHGCEVVDSATGEGLPDNVLVDTRGKVRPGLREGRLVLRARRTEADLWIALKA
jgi:hypothetical protein